MSKKKKWTHNTGEMPWNRGDPSSDVAIHFLFRVGHEYGIYAFLLQGKRSQLYMDILIIRNSFFILIHGIIIV